MSKRYVAIWFRYLKTDWVARRHPELRNTPFVLAASVHGRMVIKAANPAAQQKDIDVNMVVADCRAILPSLQVLDDIPGQAEKLLNALAEWCLRYAPIVAVDHPNGLLLDSSGCAHLWGGEKSYLKDITTKLKGFGYDVKLGMADTIGTAWAVSRYENNFSIVEPFCQLDALLYLPPAALRLEDAVLERLEKLGFYHIKSFISMPRNAIRRRFGQSILTRLDQAMGQEYETVLPIQPVEPYQERLPSFEPIATLAGIEIALRKLLERLCERLTGEEKGLRKCIFKCFRIDGIVQQIEIGTSQPSRHVEHLFKLFELKIATIEPALGIEVFTIEATVVEDISATQEAMWEDREENNSAAISELLDRIATKLGADTIHRYLPDEHYWPERSIKLAASLSEKKQTDWRTNLLRPIHLLPAPETIVVTAPIPDYPPISFRYKGELHYISKADGPERIEQEWWLQQGEYRDYYCVEDKEGKRYWIFRLGSYEDGNPTWFIHGFFA